MNNQGRMDSLRLSYKKFYQEDLKYLSKMMKDPLVLQYFPGPNTYPDETIQKYLDFFIKSFGYKVYHRVYKISLKEYNEPIGYGGIQYVKEFDKFEVMFSLNPAYWGKGYGTEISLRMIELAKEIGLTEVIALADVQNCASNHVLVKSGFILKDTIELWDATLHYYELKF